MISMLCCLGGFVNDLLCFMFQDGDGHFAINSNGIVSIKQMLDYESTTEFSLNVSVYSVSHQIEHIATLNKQ